MDGFFLLPPAQMPAHVSNTSYASKVRYSLDESQSSSWASTPGQTSPNSFLSEIYSSSVDALPSSGRSLDP